MSVRRGTLLDRERCCSFKRRYTLSELHHAIEGMKRSRKRRLRMRGYHCPFCRFYHLTSRNT